MPLLTHFTVFFELVYKHILVTSAVLSNMRFQVQFKSPISENYIYVISADHTNQVAFNLMELMIFHLSTISITTNSCRFNYKACSNLAYVTNEMI